MTTRVGVTDRTSRRPLAPVRQLRLGDVEGSTAAGEEWYETERLSGQITGGAASEPPVDRQAPGHDQRPVLLDWRHVQGAPAPTAVQRLRERLDRRRRRREPRASRSDVPRAPRGRRARRAAAGASNAPASTLRAPERRAAAEQNRIPFADDPRADTREPRERMRSRASRSAHVAIADRRGGQRPLRWALIGAGVMVAIGGSVGTVASRLDSTPANPHQASRVAATRLGAALHTVATTMSGALAAAESHVRQRPVSGRVANRHHSAGVVITATIATTRVRNPIRTPAYTPVALHTDSFSRQVSSSSYRPSTSYPSYQRSSIASPDSSSSPAGGSGGYRQATPSSPTRASTATTATPRPISSASNATDESPGVPGDPPPP